MAKNVVLVTEGRSKFMVSLLLGVWLSGGTRLTRCSSAGREEQVLQQQAAEDQPHPAAEGRRAQKHGGSSAQLMRL